MRSLKHVGRVKNTGRRCVVVFRELYNDQGKVIDEHNCLIIESETLPDAEHQDIMQIVESDTMQEASNAFEVFARSRLGNGQTSLAWMHSTGRLRKMPTNNVELTPNTTRMQNAGASQADIENVLQDDTDPTARDAKLTESTPATNQNTPSQASSDGVLSDAEIAQVRLNQAVEFEAQAKELRDQAYNLDPSLKPRRGRPAKKAAAKTKA
jgi:hypothetical protein